MQGPPTAGQETFRQDTKGSGLPRSAGGEVRSGAVGGAGQRLAQMEFSSWALKASRDALPPVA